MGELVFVGLGLHDEKGITLRGLEEARACELLFAEFYTSALPGADPEAVARAVGRPVRVLSREEVEAGDAVLEAAKDRRVGFLVAGDPMAATTHVDLRLRAAAAGIRTRIVHGVSVLTAVAGDLGLQHYKFGRTTTASRPSPGFRPTSPLEAVLANRRAGLHSLVLLDVGEGGTFLDPKAALRLLLELAAEAGASEFGSSTLVCVVSRAGSTEVRATAAPAADVLTQDLGPPPHSIVVPGELHFLEREALTAFAGAPHEGR